MEQLQVKRLRIRELLPQSGDRVQVMEVEKAKELDLVSMVTVLPNGKVAKTWDELLEGLQDYRQEEVELIRFAPLAGG